MQSGKKLFDYVGKNEKTKIVVKLQKRGSGPPGREPVVSEEQKKQMMLQAYRRQEELKVSHRIVFSLGFAHASEINKMSSVLLNSLNVESHF